MPSEEARVEADLGARVLEALEVRIEAFRTAVATAEEEVRSYVRQQRGAKEFKGEQALVELGQFAVGRIDPERFSMLMGDAEELTPDAVNVLDRADLILATFVNSGEVHRVAVPPGGDLRDAVKDALTHVGQVFGAARAVELARAGTFDPEQHDHFLGALPFRFWNRAERGLAPPLVVDVRGEDCLPAGLGEFLDGSVTIVLVVSGPTTPAPLARLITPGTFVMQTAEPADVARMAASPHPGVALLFDAERPEQARFVHDPEAGSEPWQRLEIGHVPAQPDVGRGRRAPIWLEELKHLGTLAREPAGAVAQPAGTDGTDGTAATIERAPADQLAAWLLSQADLNGA